MKLVLSTFSSLNKKRITAISLIIIFVLSTAYVGIGYAVASASLSINPGCGIWSNNTPDNWTTNDDWNSFEPYNDSEERINIRRDFDVSNLQMDSYENITFNPRGNSEISLRGWYVEVDSEAPVVIQTHGMPINGKCKPEMLLMQSYLSEGGINTLSFDLRNYGESDVVDDYFAVGQIEYNDLLGAYDWLVSEKEYMPGEVGMAAFSAGGGAAIAFAEESGIGAMWLDSAVLDFPLLVKNELGRLGYPQIFAGPAITVGGWLVGVELDARSPMEAALNSDSRPVFLTHGMEDPRVSIVHSQNFEERMNDVDGNISTWYVPSRGHVDAIWGESDEYKNNIVTFFSNGLSS